MQHFEKTEVKAWNCLIECLEKHKEENRHGFWTDGDQILCRSEKDAESVANLLEDLGFDKVLTGHYDPVEDEREGTTDAHTGCWYVCPD